MTSPDVVVVGAGIVGSACADALTRAGARVTIFDPAPAAGTTAAGMGHILIADEDPNLYALTHRGRTLWEEASASMPPAAQWDRAGTIWVAADETELELAREKAQTARARGERVELLDAAGLRDAEPNLAPDLVGALFLPDDRTLYPPAAAAWLRQRAESRGAHFRRERVVELSDDGVRTQAGETVSAGTVVLATGSAPELLPRLLTGTLRPRKGHLAITRQYPGFLRHHVAELGYFASTDPSNTESIAFNVQPRVTGQVLIGASRQLGVEHRDVDRGLVARMFSRALTFMPALAQLDVLRVWTGFRPATADKLPFIGPVPGQPNLHVAIGHEGLGIATSLSTGELVAAGVLGTDAAFDPEPFSPARIDPASTPVGWRTSA